MIAYGWWKTGACEDARLITDKEENNRSYTQAAAAADGPLSQGDDHETQ
jgi:hypothetical protein